MYTCSIKPPSPAHGVLSLHVIFERKEKTCSEISGLSIIVNISHQNTFIRFASLCFSYIVFELETSSIFPAVYKRMTSCIA